MERNFPNYSKTYACTKAALSTCKKYNIKEVLCTAWMDNGAETPMDALLPGLDFLHTLIFTETMTKQSLSRSSGTAQAENLMILWHLTILILYS